MTAPRRQLLWMVAHEAALMDLPRALAAMGFEHVTPPFPRGGTLELRTEYHRFRRMPRRVETDTTRAWDARDRERIAELNRGLHYSPCRLAWRTGGLGVYLDTVSGDWADYRGGARGDCMITLAMLCWKLPYGRAAFRLARTCGVEAIPHAA